MPKLPHLPRRPRPPGEAERLSRWFREWDLEQRLREEESEYAEPMRPPSIENRSHHRELAAQNLIAPFDTEVKVGQIRILHGGMFAEVRRPMHVAILSEWPPPDTDSDIEARQPSEVSRNIIPLPAARTRLSDTSGDPIEEQSYLVAPFGDYREPATTTEWLTGREAGPFRVLCLWNSHDYAARWLELSWEVGELTKQELSDAWNIFRHSLTGVPLSDRLREQVGAPIIHPRDPRLAYQAEEARLFTIVPEYAECRWRLEEGRKSGIAPSNLIHLNFELALAAGSEGGTGGEMRDYMVFVRSLDIRIWFHRSSAGGNLFAEVFAADGSRSEALNGATLLNQEGNVLAQFEDKKATFPIPASGSRLLLRNTSGDMLSWEILNES